ncbi:MAG: hypothetical protein ACHQEA_03320 [Gaiellales bacterium]|jgi:hypothetical protein
MPADIRARLAAADPARELRPIEAGDSDLLLRSIIGATTPRVVRRRTRARSSRLLLAAALLAVLLVGAGFTAYRVAFESGTAGDVRRSFATVRDTVPLPPGTTWHELNLDPDGIYAGSPDRTALVMALFQAQCAWVGYWDAADRGGDATQAGNAVHGMQELRSVMPVHHPGDSEDMGGFDDSSLDAWDALVAGAAAGDPTLPRQYLRANC